MLQRRLTPTVKIDLIDDDWSEHGEHGSPDTAGPSSSSSSPSSSSSSVSLRGIQQRQEVDNLGPSDLYGIG